MDNWMFDPAANNYRPEYLVYHGQLVQLLIDLESDLTHSVAKVAHSCVTTLVIKYNFRPPGELSGFDWLATPFAEAAIAKVQEILSRHHYDILTHVLVPAAHEILQSLYHDFGLEPPDYRALLRTALAAEQHAIWAYWMTYLFSVCVQNDDWSVTIPADKVLRWRRQMGTGFDELSADEQRIDYNQAEKVLRVIDAIPQLSTLVGKKS